MIVGDAPSLTDSRVGEYLQGKTGSLLRAELQKAGFSDTPYYTGVVKCTPPDGVKPEAAEMKACAYHLQREIEANKPLFILTLGASATKAVAKEAKITTSVGKVIERDGITYMPCFSPAYVLRDPGKSREFQKTIKRFYDLTHGKNSEEGFELRVRIIDRSNLDEFMEAFSREVDFAYDLETSGLDHYRDDSFINCVGTYLPRDETAWILPIRKAPTLPQSAQDQLIKWMADQKKLAVGHNVKFDSLWIRKKVGTHFHSHFDTMLAHYMLDENSPHGLKELARYYLNAPDYDLTTQEKRGIGVTAEKIFKYCGLDCYYTYRLYKLFSRELFKDLETRNLFNRLMMPMSRLYERIEVSGHHVNLDRMKKTRAEMSALMESELRQLNRMIGREVNWNSPAQVGQALYNDLGLTPTIKTAKGANSTGEAALADLDHPVVKLLTDYRGHQKFISTYIDGWEEYMVGDKLFLSTKLHGTVTGRFSSRLHQVPRDGSIRNLIEAPQGYTFVQADLSQAELRVIAIVSQDPELIRCYKEGIDVHWKTTMGILRLGGSQEDLAAAYETVSKYMVNPPNVMADVLDELEKMGPEEAAKINKLWKEKRKQSKGVNFGYVYGMGAFKFCEYAKLRYDWILSPRKSGEVRDGFFCTYLGLTPWHDRMRSLVKIDGEVRSLSGRKRRLPGIWSPDREVVAEAERQAINSPIQGFIGDFKAMGMLEIDDKTDHEEVIIKGEVHDSVLMWVKTDTLDRNLPLIKHCMENPSLISEFGIQLPVPLLVDLEVGTWGAGKPWHPTKEEKHA